MKLIEMEEDERVGLLDELATLGAVCAIRAWHRTREYPAVSYHRMTDEDERDFTDVLRAYGVEYEPTLKAVFWAGAAGEEVGLIAPDSRERGH